MAVGAPDLGRRALSACLFVPLVLVLTWLGGWTLFALVVLIVGRGCWEFYRLAEAAGHRPAAKIGVVVSVAWCAHLQCGGAESSLLPLLVIITLVAATVTLRTGVEGYASNALVTVGGFVYVGVLGSTPLLIAAHTSQLGWSHPSSILVILFLAIWITDTAAYFFGHYFGERKLVPSISPAKTVVGFGAGVAAGFVPLVVHQLVPLSLAQLAGLLLLVAIGGQIGDIVESAIKRDAGVKDAPAFIPGHGGLLDRFDSYLFAFPLCYLYLLVMTYV